MDRLAITNDNILRSLTEMMDRTKLGAGYLNRVVYNQYKRRQRKRWMTENVSEQQPKWAALTPAYESYKKKKWASYPGAGSKTMIRTQRLFNAVTGDNDKSEHRKIIIGKTRIEIGWTTPYAVFTEEMRPVNTWDPKQDKQMYDGFVKYLMDGIMPIITGQ